MLFLFFLLCFLLCFCFNICICWSGLGAVLVLFSLVFPECTTIALFVCVCFFLYSYDITVFPAILGYLGFNVGSMFVSHVCFWFLLFVSVLFGTFQDVPILFQLVFLFCLNHKLSYSYYLHLVLLFSLEFCNC